MSYRKFFALTINFSKCDLDKSFYREPFWGWSKKRFKCVSKTSWKRVNKNSLIWWYTFRTFWRHLKDVLKTFLQHVFKTFRRRLENLLKTYWRCLEDVFGRRLKDALNTSWRRLGKTSWTRFKDVLKVSWRRMT